MKTKTFLAVSTLSLFAVTGPSRGDTIELKNGSAIQGNYVGGTATTLSIETPQGVLAVQTTDIRALVFTTPPPLPPAVVLTPAAAAPVWVPAGTVLTIRMESQVSSKDPGGKKFTATLLADLMAGNITVAKAGTTVYGQIDESKQAGRLAGKSELAISLTSIALPTGALPILTTNFAEAGKGEFRRTARNVAAGALIGNAIDRSGGAGKGAAVGVGVSLTKKGDSVTIPPGALLEFRLTQPVSASPL